MNCVLKNVNEMKFRDSIEDRISKEIIKMVTKKLTIAYSCINDIDN